MKEQQLAEVLEMLGKKKLSKKEQWMFDNYWDNSEYELKKDTNGKLWVHKKQISKLNDEQIKELWGEDLYNVFAEHIDEYGRLTAEWQNIIENEIPRFDKHYNDNPLFKETYGRMYCLEYEVLENETLIIPTKP